jgi:DNA-binding transcriptional ArsR family regulator
MVERSPVLDAVFLSLADPTRRDILRRVAREELSVSEISEPYRLTFAAISKHLKVLENAHLVVKRRRGREQMVRMSPKTIESAASYLEEYKRLWENRLDALEEYLKTMR